MPTPNEKLTPPTLVQIKNCKDKGKLIEYRKYLMENVTRLITENYIEWSVWEHMICQIDYQVDGTPLSVSLTPRKNEVKWVKV